MKRSLLMSCGLIVISFSGLSHLEVESSYAMWFIFPFHIFGLMIQFLHWLTRLSERNRRLIIKPADLPEDIIIEILSRIPADEVLKCRRLCKKWRSLTSTSHFVEYHLQHSLPMVFVQYNSMCSISENASFFLDENAEMKRVCARSSKVRKMQRIAPQLAGSCNGLLLFKPWDNPYPLTSMFFVCNPITDEIEMLNKPFREGHLIGFFFHSFTKEYRILYVHRNQYFILTLGKAKQWRSLGTFAYLPHPSRFPVIISKTLHWVVEYSEYDASCENSIMLFNMDTEEFSTLPHPGDQCFSRFQHGKMYLLEMNEKLSFWRVCNGYILAWVLTDCDSWDWNKTFKISLDSIVNRYPLDRDVFDEYDIGLINLQSNELLLVWSNRGVFRYTLETNLIKEVDVGRRTLPYIRYEFSFISYIKSLVSLRCLYERRLELWPSLASSSIQRSN